MGVAAENLQVAEDREPACALPGPSVLSHFALGYFRKVGEICGLLAYTLVLVAL